MQWKDCLYTSKKVPEDCEGVGFWKTCTDKGRALILLSSVPISKHNPKML